MEKHKDTLKELMEKENIILERMKKIDFENFEEFIRNIYGEVIIYSDKTTCFFPKRKEVALIIENYERDIKDLFLDCEKSKFGKKEGMKLLIKLREYFNYLFNGKKILLEFTIKPGEKQ